MKQNYITPFYILLLLLFPMHNYSQTVITIGNGNNSGTSAPIATFYNTSATESIYTGTEIGMVGGITKIGYYKNSGASTTNPYVQVYMKSTSLATIGTVAYVPGVQNLSEYTLVYDGEFPNYNTSGLLEVNLSRPFNFTDTSKSLSVLVLGVTCIPSGRPQYRYTTTPTKMAATYNDGAIGCGGTIGFTESATFSPVWERPNLTLTMSALSAETFDASGVAVFVNNNQLQISSGNSAIKNIELFDLTGRKLSFSEINSKEAVINPDIPNQVVIAKITAENNTVITKKILL